MTQIGEATGMEEYGQYTTTQHKPHANIILTQMKIGQSLNML